MFKRLIILFVLGGLILIIIQNGCRVRLVKNTVTVHILSDPGNMSPLLYNNEIAVGLNEKIFETLVGMDHTTMKPVPVLADSLPTMRTDEKGHLMFNYHLRKDATWDNGEPITANDVAFSLKLALCDSIGDKRLKSYYEKVSDFIPDAKDPRAFTIVFSETYIQAEEAANELIILPQYFYDAKNVLGNLPVKYFIEQKKDFASNTSLLEYANWINNMAFDNDTTSLIGSGPYKLSGHHANYSLTLKRKDKWWGDNYNDRNDYFRAYPTTINYRIIPDPSVAYEALKAGNIDVMHGIKPKQFMELKNNASLQDKFNLYNPQMFMFTYFGMNLKNPKFSDVRVRQAICYLTDVKKIINVVNYGLNNQIVGPVMPSKKEAYNNDIKLYAFDLEKAKQLLAEAGWKDSDGDGILDKMIDGHKIPFTIEFIYNAGVESRRDAIKIFKEDAIKAGIDVHVNAIEKQIYSSNLKNHKFEMCYGGFNPNSYPDDFKQLYYSTSANGSSNYVNYNSAACDSLLNKIRVTLNPVKRNEEYKQLQLLLHNDAPMVFLFQINERIAINKKYSGTNPSGISPGFWEPGFRVTKM